MSFNNSIHIMGRLVATPELKNTPNGVAVTTFTVAVNRDYVKRGEERQTDFIDCVAWRNSAEFVCRYFEKGKEIGIEGHLQTRNYEDKNGGKRKAVEVVVDNVSFVGAKEKSVEPAAPAYNPEEFTEVENDDDLPF